MTTKTEDNNTYQRIEPSNVQYGNRTWEEIDIEVRKGFIDVGIETSNTYGETNYTHTSLTREQAWEHIHNLLFAMDKL